MKKQNKKELKKRNWLVLFACLLLTLATTWSLPTPVLAQSEARRVQQQISTINRQLRTLQETVLEHIDDHGNGVADNERALLADMEIRLGAIDREFRMLTGQIEEMDHRQRQLIKQFEIFKADMELRFQDLSQGAIVPSTQPLSDEVPDLEVEAATQTDVIVEDDAATETTEATEVTEDTEAEKAEEISPVQLTAEDPQASYEQAFGFLRRGDFAGGESAFKAFLDLYSDHDLAGNAQYWLAETYYARRDYPNAAASFLKGFQDYADGAKAPDSLLKLGMSLAAMEQVEEACIVFEDLKLRYSDAPQAILDSADREVERNNCSQ